ncbi:group II intron maturase-specific domain-containing protein [Enterococcus mundtii]|nr:group II intron maturase-specific domain-containing protein [Enterococcus mundtii]
MKVLFKEIKQLINGWINYYDIGEMKGYIHELIS